MKVIAWISAGTVLAAAAVWAGEPSSFKPGLWEITSHDNWAMFVVSHDRQPPEERARVSAKALEHFSFARACATAAARPETVVLDNYGCKLTAQPVRGGVQKIDGVCSGRRDGTTEIHITATTDSPEHATVDVTRMLDAKAGYPVIEAFEMHWVSADCGDIPAGQMRYVRAPGR